MDWTYFKLNSYKRNPNKMGFLLTIDEVELLKVLKIKKQKV